MRITLKFERSWPQAHAFWWACLQDNGQEWRSSGHSRPAAAVRDVRRQQRRWEKHQRKYHPNTARSTRPF